MKVAVAGGSGFLGRPLCEVYAEEGHEVVVLTRSLPPGAAEHEAGTGVPGITRHGWTPDGQIGPWAPAIEGADAVVNLAGESIAARRWSAAHKQRVHDSRVLATRSLAAAILAAARPPRVFVSSSAVGYYGFVDQSEKTEASPAGDDYLADVCRDWEAEARRASRPETRVVLLRSGIPLELDGGVLPLMAMPFRFFVGGPVASGRQAVSWIHRLDWVELVRWLAATDEAAGAFNATAPAPVTNRELSRAIAHALHRPSWLWTPAFPLRLVLGDMADALLIGGQRVVPARALSMGFSFRYPEIDQALRAIYET